MENMKYKTTFCGLFNIVFMNFEIQYNAFLKPLEEAGYSENEICFAMYQDQSKLHKYVMSGSIWNCISKSVFKVYCDKNDGRKEKYEAIMKEKKKTKPKGNMSRKSVNGYVYFIQSVDGGAVKIGFSENVDKRLNDLQTASPEKLVVIKQFKGSIADEHKVHSKLNKYRIRGEWFEEEVLNVFNEQQFISERIKTVG